MKTNRIFSYDTCILYNCTVVFAQNAFEFYEEISSTKLKFNCLDNILCGFTSEKNSTIPRKELLLWVSHLLELYALVILQYEFRF